ncbi:MAG TPA: hypothetical protein VGE98_16175, partial [Thermoanaerobaculia bacterium]
QSERRAFGGAEAPLALRPLAPGDIPAVTDLHRRVFGPAGGGTPDLEATLRQIFCGHPWQDDRLPSLVYAEDGEVRGCLGVMPRPIWVGDEPAVAAVSHNFMVDPRSRHRLVGIELLKAFFAGPQDLSLAEGNDVSRQIWQALGGSVATLYSLRWTRPLRPLSYGLSLASRHGLAAFWSFSLAPLCAALDRVGRRLARPAHDPEAEGIAVEPLAVPWLLAGIERFGRRATVRPRYSQATLTWLLATAAHPPPAGELRCRQVLCRDEPVGWYVYQLGPSRVAEVLQLGVAERWARTVLRELFAEAGRSGAIAVSGQLEPRLLAALSEERCLFHRGRGGSWILAHSRRPEVLQALHRGDAFFSRLEGEWWIGHRLTRAKGPRLASRLP